MCFVLAINLSASNIAAGKNVITVITPNKTPFAITIPISLPKVKFILHSAKNPAIVVTELPNTDEIVFEIASAIASSLLSLFFLSAQ